MDITITTPIIFPLSLPLPVELQQYISIIQILESQRRLERFLIFLPVKSDPTIEMSIGFIQDMLPLWTVQHQLVYSVNFGDPIAVYRVVLFGFLDSENPPPKVNLASVNLTLNIQLREYRFQP